MTKKSQPPKGFIQELASHPKPEHKASTFEWRKPVATKGKAVDRHTERRLKEHRAMPKPPERQQLQKQYDAMIAKRREK